MTDRNSPDSKPHRLRPVASGNVEPPVWSVPIVLVDISASGKHVELRPDEVTRAAIAKAAGVLAVPRLQATFDLAPLANDGVKVTGRVSASVQQSCVVTLEPMLNEVDEPVDLILVQPGAMPPPRAALDIDVSGEADAPDVLHDNAVDVGAIATEFLILAIDPYPRKAGASFEAPRAADDPAAHPFAALAALKRDSGPKDA